MEIQLKLYGSSKILSDKDILHIELPINSNIEKLRSALNKIISKKHLNYNPKTDYKSGVKKFINWYIKFYK